MSTNTDLDPTKIIAFFVRRWQIEVTFGETRAHLGVETQRQWNDNAIMPLSCSFNIPMICSSVNRECFILSVSSE